MEPHVEPRRLLVVEDDPLTSTLLADVLTGHGFEVRVERTAGAARNAIDDFDPDAALLDISLGDGPSGVSLAHVLHRQHPHVALMFLTRYPDAQSAGLLSEDVPPGCGFLRKDLIADSDYLLVALEEALADRAGDIRHDRGSDNPFGSLTPTQAAVLRMVAQGLTNAGIAARRGTSESAVEQAVLGIGRRLGIPSAPEMNFRVEVARRYIEVAGLPELPV